MLQGLSGCKIKQIDSNTVRKISPNPSYNNRLAAQAKKQSYFKHLNFANIHSPAIFQTGSDYFDMEFINGKSFLQFFETASKQDLDNVGNSLNEYFGQLIENEKWYDQTIIRKLLRDKLQTFKENTVFPSILDETAGLLSNISLIKIPKTFCHGDLTLANVIFQDKKIFLIDFLDSFIDSYYMDLVKLKQDLYYGWTFGIQNNHSLRVKQSCSYLWNKLTDYPLTKEPIFKVLDRINFFRIEPYLQDFVHKQFLGGIMARL